MRKLAPHADSKETLESVLDFLMSKKLLCDERFAEVRAHWLARKYGAAKIRHDLKQKGVSEALADRIASDANDVEKAKAILKRKYRDQAMTRAERARRARFLQGRGFSYDVIRAVVMDAEGE